MNRMLCALLGALTLSAGANAGQDICLLKQMNHH